MRTVKMIVAATNANGDPDFFFCKVRCTFEEYKDGEHYVLAERKAIDEGYEPHLSMDEDDPGGKAILDKFVWESATEYTV